MGSRTFSSPADDAADPENQVVPVPRSEHPFLPFMSSLIRPEGPAMETPAAPVPPPPPPLPPRRKVSVEPLFLPSPTVTLPARNLPRPLLPERYTGLKKTPTFYLRLALAVLRYTYAFMCCFTLSLSESHPICMELRKQLVIVSVGHIL